MRVGMEEAIFDDLLDVVIGQLGTDFIQIIAVFEQLRLVVHGDAVDELHRQHLRRGFLAIDARTGGKDHVFVVLIKGFGVLRLDGEVHLLLRDLPHLVQYDAEIEDFAGARGELEDACRLAQQRHVLRHDFVDALALHLDHDVRAILEARFMRLRDGRRADGLLVEIRIHFLDGLAERALHYPAHLVKGHGRHGRAQLRQRVTIGLRNHVRTHRHDLAELDIGGAEILQYGAQLFGR